MFRGCIVGLAVMLAMGQVQAQQPVEVSEVVLRHVTLSLNLVGTVEPFLAATVSAEIPGQVAEVLVEEDDRVERNQILARLDREVLEVRLRQAKARSEQAQSEYGRVKMLVEQNLGSLERLQQAETNLALRKADFELVHLSLKNADIRSPFSGVVAHRYTERGEWITTGGRVADVIKTDSLFIVTSVPEKHVRYLKPGLKATIVCDAQPDEMFAGSIHLVVPLADEASHAFPVKIVVPNPDGKLMAGMFARVDLEIEAAERLVLVPKDAVVNVTGERYVFEVRDGLAHRVKVQIGRSEGEYISVLGEVKPGAQVIVTGNESLRDQAEVSVMKVYKAKM